MHEVVTEWFISVDYVSFIQANNSEGNIGSPKHFSMSEF